jgi:membrane associated rhomboid family serine protease
MSPPSHPRQERLNSAGFIAFQALFGPEVIALGSSGTITGYLGYFSVFLARNPHIVNTKPFL